MPKILITGNGFDLNIGLPTSYNDFIKILNYIKANKTDFHPIYKNSQNYKKIINAFDEFDLDEEQIKILKGELKENIWFDFFENEYQIDTWIDFENRIEYVLKILFTSLEYIQTNIFSKGSLDKDSLNWTPETFNHNIELIEVIAKFSIVKFDKSYNVTLNKEFLIERYNYYSDLDLEKITELLYRDLIKFKKIFNLYFEIFVIPFYNTLKKNLDLQHFSFIDYHYTFNYTPTFDNLINNKKNTRYLHGRIDSYSNRIVVGINEIPTEKVSKKHFLPFTKYFQKLNNETDYIFLKEFEKQSGSNFMFLFYGHSLDQSDKDYINEVFDFVNNLKSPYKQIVVIYHNLNSKSKLLINLLNIRGKNDIQEMMRSKILVFRHKDSPDLEEDLKRDIKRQYVV